VVLARGMSEGGGVGVRGDPRLRANYGKGLLATRPAGARAHALGGETGAKPPIPGLGQPWSLKVAGNQPAHPLSSNYGAG